ncbi:MAG: hypothetical protein KJN67_03940 [Pontiella sp.]|nr:hypothetical protein [Pontiella sp.]NNJ70289.1 hypothetical protein [Kiritimatiellales bacterium]
MRKIALILLLLLAGFLAWGLLTAGNVTLMVNGKEVVGPMAAVLGGWGFLIATVTLWCAAIVMAFVLAGVGLLIVGLFLLIGLVLATLLFPFLLPLLFPLFIVWLFVAGVRKSAAPADKNPS